MPLFSCTVQAVSYLFSLFSEAALQHSCAEMWDAFTSKQVFFTLVLRQTCALWHQCICRHNDPRPRVERSNRSPGRAPAYLKSSFLQSRTLHIFVGAICFGGRRRCEETFGGAGFCGNAGWKQTCDGFEMKNSVSAACLPCLFDPDVRWKGSARRVGGI